MSLINQVVSNALLSGYLTAEAEVILSRHFQSSCNMEDIAALTILQRAVLSGMVKRQSQNCDQLQSA